MPKETLQHTMRSKVRVFEDGGIRLLRKGQKGLIHAIFSRFGLVLVLLVLQFGALFSLMRWFSNLTVENMVNYINDIAGIRIVCSFTSDIYRLAEMIGKQNDLTVVSIKDYIKNPKASGYKSFHMHVTIPIFLSDRVVDTKVEIQIRTIAMDFWASLEHKIYYKFEGNAPDYISRDLRACAEIVSDLDAKMLQLNEAILEEKAKQEEKENN